MRQDEKNQQSRERILQAALEAFGEKGYDGASLNTTLLENGLSKGLVYHYFDNKDQLYLACVKLCFDKLMDALSTVETSDDAQSVLQLYFAVRSRFFREHPRMERIFSDVLLQPPVHLREALAKARADFDTFNRALFLCVLGSLQLRGDVSEADALRHFELMQNALHLQFRTALDAGCYEAQAYKTLELLLYGLIGGKQS